MKTIETATSIIRTWEYKNNTNKYELVAASNTRSFLVPPYKTITIITDTPKGMH
jgi:hypothetical protein